MNNPMYLGVRQEIAGARRELARVSIPDYVGITTQLDSIQQSIVDLPFRGEASVSQEAGTATEMGWWEKIKDVFSNLVTIRHSTKEENKRISLEDKDYIRQRLWLQLEIAHLSLMRREQKAFGNTLERVRETLSTWFDSEDSTYMAVIREIDGLLALKIDVEIPDITAPWATLRLVRGSQPKPAPPLAAPSAITNPVIDSSAEQNGQEEDQE
jgi:uncharacterized protein HemX